MHDTLVRLDNDYITAHGANQKAGANKLAARQSLARAAYRSSLTRLRSDYVVSLRRKAGGSTAKSMLACFRGSGLGLSTELMSKCAPVYVFS